MITVLNLIRKITNRLYTFFLKSSFHSLGKKSFINFPATVNCPQAMSIGDNVWIREHAWLNCTSKEGEKQLTIGSGTVTGRYLHINAYKSVILEDKVLLSDRVFISDVHHSFEDSTKPIVDQGVTEPKPVLLKTGCWIGIGACIMPGVTIGKNAIVGANAVVTKDVPDNAIALGIPAKIVSERPPLKSVNIK